MPGLHATNTLLRVLFFLLVPCLLLTRQPPLLAQSKAVTVLLYDGKLPEQVALEAAVREALAPHKGKVELRSMHAGRAETVPLLRRHGLKRGDAPLLLLMSDETPQAKITRRVPLKGAGDADGGVRTILTALRLPLPRVQPPAPGPVATVVPGAPEEKKLLVMAAGAQRLEKGIRILDATGVLLYRARLPRGLRKADLRAELGGNYVIESAPSPKGPWTVLMDSDRYFVGAADLITERKQPVADLAPVLEKLAGDLYLKIYPNGRGRNQATLARLEIVALGPEEASGQADWLKEAERLRKERLAALPPGAAEGTPLSGVLDKDTTLAAARSPYTMTGDLVVGYGIKLTIEPGVTVRVLGNHALRVQGQLVAKGTRDRPIHLVSAAGLQPDDWKGVQFFPAPNSQTRAGGVLEYCRIAHASTVELNRFDGEVSHCILESCLAGLTLRNGGSGRIHHNRFLKCQYGMVVDGGAGEVTENEWVDCLVALAVAALPAEKPFRFENNSIVGSKISAVNYLKNPTRPVPALSVPRNHWSGTAPERMVGGGNNAAEVRFDPRLDTPPANVGPGWN
jgi:hypothetical protein